MFETETQNAVGILAQKNYMCVEDLHASLFHIDKNWMSDKGFKRADSLGVQPRACVWMIY